MLAFVELHVRVELLFAATELGFATSVTVGGGVTIGGGVTAFTVTATLLCAVPPAPEQVSVKFVFAFSAPVD